MMSVKLLQGDCLELMKDIPDGSIDMILADLPYGTTACKWDEIIPFEPLWEQYERVIKDNGAIVLTASQPFTTKLINSNIELLFDGNLQIKTNWELMWDININNINYKTFRTSVPYKGDVSWLLTIK